MIGGGPAGSRAAARLALAGHEVVLYDRSFDREKPCGGGVPWRGLGLLSLAPIPPSTSRLRSHRPGRHAEADEDLGDRRATAATRPVATHPSALQAVATHPVAAVDGESAGEAAAWPAPGAGIRRIAFEGPSGRRVEVPLRRPVAIFSRRELDRALLETSEAAGAKLVRESVTGLARVREDAAPRAVGGDHEATAIEDTRPKVENSEWMLTLASGRREVFDHVVGADGARSLVRRTVFSPFAREDLSQAVGWYVPDRTSDCMTIRFDRRIKGYLWIFPRPDHLAVGACAPLAPGVADALWETGRDLLATLGATEEGLPRYSALIPSLRPASFAANRVAGDGWSLVGDAAGTVDPITREGIAPGIRSAELLADALAPGATETYEDLWRRTFLPEFSWAARHCDRFFDPGRTESLVRWVGRSGSLRAVLADVIIGEQDYLSLKRRLLRSALPAGLDLLLPNRSGTAPDSRRLPGIS